MQHTSIAFGKRCKETGVRPSMGSAGDCYDNAMCESFFATLECELLDRTVQDAGRGKNGRLRVPGGVVQSASPSLRGGKSLPNGVRKTTCRQRLRLKCSTVHQTGGTPGKTRTFGLFRGDGSKSEDSALRVTSYAAKFYLDTR